MLERATQLATDFTTQDLERWYSVWGRRLLTTQRRVRTPAQPISSDTTEAGDIVRADSPATRRGRSSTESRHRLSAIAGRSRSERHDQCLDRRVAHRGPRPLSRHRRATCPNCPFSFALTPWSRPLRLAAATLVGLLGLVLQRWPRHLSVAPQWAVVDVRVGRLGVVAVAGAQLAGLGDRGSIPAGDGAVTITA